MSNYNKGTNAAKPGRKGDTMNKRTLRKAKKTPTEELTSTAKSRISQIWKNTAPAGDDVHQNVRQIAMKWKDKAVKQRGNGAPPAMNSPASRPQPSPRNNGSRKLTKWEMHQLRLQGKSAAGSDEESVEDDPFARNAIRPMSARTRSSPQHSDRQPPSESPESLSPVSRPDSMRHTGRDMYYQMRKTESDEKMNDSLKSSSDVTDGTIDMESLLKNQSHGDWLTGEVGTLDMEADLHVVQKRMQKQQERQKAAASAPRSSPVLEPKEERPVPPLPPPMAEEPEEIERILQRDREREKKVLNDTRNRLRRSQSLVNPAVRSNVKAYMNNGQPAGVEIDDLDGLSNSSGENTNALPPGKKEKAQADGKNDEEDDLFAEEGDDILARASLPRRRSLHGSSSVPSLMTTLDRREKVLEKRTELRQERGSYWGVKERIRKNKTLASDFKPLSVNPEDEENDSSVRPISSRSRRKSLAGLADSNAANSKINRLQERIDKYTDMLEKMDPEAKEANKPLEAEVDHLREQVKLRTTVERLYQKIRRMEFQVKGQEVMHDLTIKEKETEHKKEIALLVEQYTQQLDDQDQKFTFELEAKEQELAKCMDDLAAALTSSFDNDEMQSALEEEKRKNKELQEKLKALQSASAHAAAQVDEKEAKDKDDLAAVRRELYRVTSERNELRIANHQMEEVVSDLKTQMQKRREPADIESKRPAQIDTSPVVDASDLEGTTETDPLRSTIEEPLISTATDNESVCSLESQNSALDTRAF